MSALATALACLAPAAVCAAVATCGASSDVGSRAEDADAYAAGWVLAVGFTVTRRTVDMRPPPALCCEPLLLFVTIGECDRPAVERAVG